MSDRPAQARILPFYLVVDVSYSMQDQGKIDSANGIVGELKDALAEHPVIADKVRIGVIDFSDDSRVVLPLCDLSSHNGGTESFEVRGGTSYVAAFERLRSQIEQDVKQLKADGFAVHRPAVFFISDGEPTDADGEWRRAFADLTTYDKQANSGFAYYPNVIPFGVGASTDVLRELIFPRDRSRAYYMKEGANAGAALRQMAEILVSSTLSSGASVGEGGPSFVLPDETDLGDMVETADYGDLLD